MRRHLRPDELGSFLASPTCGTLATYRRDGSVLLSPIWYEWDDGGVTAHLGADDSKTKHLRRDPRASFVVYENVPPYRGLEVRGTAHISTTDEKATLRRLAVRYLGDREGNAYADAATWDGVVLRLEPGDLRVWDFVDDYGERD